MSSPLSGGQTFNPFYSYTLADSSTVYSTLSMTNPSVPIDLLLKRLYQHDAILAVAPAVENSNGQQAQQFVVYLQNILAATIGSSVASGATVQLFSSEEAINAYITDGAYGDVGAGGGNKIAFAIIFNNFDVTTAQFDYSIRANFTNGQNSQYQTVACLSGPAAYGPSLNATSTGNDDYSNSSPGSGGSDIPPACDFTFTIPSSKYYTNDLSKPQSAQNFFGYFIHCIVSFV
jgi:hypothetical protein